MKKLTQREKILQVFKGVANGLINPVGYICIKDGHKWLSARYLKQVMLVSECNGRISELRADGHDILTLEGEKDTYGFAYHRLVGAPQKRWTGEVEYVERDGVRYARKIYA